MRRTRVARLIVALVSGWVTLHATTLSRLNLDEMVDKSTAIVRARVVATRSELRGSLIYTFYTIQPLERWKGTVSASSEIVILGGEAGGVRQSFAGSPQLAIGDEYVFFLWTGQSGLTQIMGLSQGVFRIQPDGRGGYLACRAASTETLLDPKTGRVVYDETLRMPLVELRSCVKNRVAPARAR